MNHTTSHHILDFCFHSLYTNLPCNKLSRNITTTTSSKPSDERFKIRLLQNDDDENMEMVLQPRDTNWNSEIETLGRDNITSYHVCLCWTLNPKIGHWIEYLKFNSIPNILTTSPKFNNILIELKKLLLWLHINCWMICKTIQWPVRGELYFRIKISIEIHELWIYVSERFLTSDLGIHCNTNLR